MKTFLTLFVLVSSFSLNAQTISEQVGGVSCDFEFYSQTDTLDIIKQMLVQRPTVKSGVSTTENESYGYGYAYTSWCLEFVTSTAIPTRGKTKEERRKHKGKYKVTFQNQAGGSLFTQYMWPSKVRLWTGEIHTGTIYTYSLNLIDVPLIVLDNVSRINIERISNY